MARPTVWTQVRALERQLGAQLLEPGSRPCRLTDAGRVLVELAVAPVAGIATLQQAFQQACAEVPAQVAVGAMPGILSEHLPDCVEAFTQQQRVGEDAPGQPR